MAGAFLISAITGISRSILYLSLINMSLAVALMVFVFFAETAAGDLPTALFDTLNAVPLGPVISIVALVLVSVFFVTSGDSAAFVLSSMSTGGSENPATGVKVAWGLIVASFAAILLAAGGLDAPRTATTVAAVPFTLVMIWLCFSLFKALSQEVPQGRQIYEDDLPDLTKTPESPAEDGQAAPEAPEARQTR